MCACPCVPVYCLQASRIPHVGRMSPHQWGEGVSAAVAAHFTSLPLIKVNCYDIPSSNKDCLKLWPVTIPLKTRVLKLRLSSRLSWQKKICLLMLEAQETQSLGWEDPLEKEMATHSSILAWRIPWTEESGAIVHGVTKSQAPLSRQ